MKKERFKLPETELELLYSKIPSPEPKRMPFGNAASKRLLIVPLDEGRNHYFGGMCALAFVNIFKNVMGESVEDHFCVIPAAVYGKKINKATSTPLIDFISVAREQLGINWVVALGSDAFKHVFGKGYKPPMPSLMGHKIHMPKEYGDLNIYVLPDIDEMYEELKGDDQDYRRERNMRWHQDRMRKIITKYKKEK